MKKLKADKKDLEEKLNDIEKVSSTEIERTKKFERIKNDRITKL